MSRTIDIDKLHADTNVIAAVATADQLFGFLKRSMRVPGRFIALVTRRSGEKTVRPADAELTDDDVADVLFVRNQPIELHIEPGEVASSDSYLCQSAVRLEVRLLEDRQELEAFRDRVVGSASSVDTRRLAGYFMASIQQAVSRFAADKLAGALLDPATAASCSQAVSEALAPLCFEGGMTLHTEPRVRFECAAYQRVKQAEQRAARQLGEHAAQQQLRDALDDARKQRFSELESMLDRLSAMAGESPDANLTQLMRAFSEAQRGELYEAMFASGSRERLTQWIVVVAGTRLLYFDSQSPDTVAQTVEVDGAAGPLRSVQVDLSQPEPVLLVGAARGVYELIPNETKIQQHYAFAGAEEVRGGVNSVAANRDKIIATHSEQGIICFHRGHQKRTGELVHPELTAGARAVRGAQFTHDRFYCTIDAQVIALPLADLQATPVRYTGCPETISALCATRDGVFAGTADGRLVYWEHDRPDQPRTLHHGAHRAVESVAIVDQGGMQRLVYTDTSLAVYSRVLGDSFSCRYEATGQTLRRVEAAGDILAATTDARDRVIIWSSGRPDKPKATLPILQLTGRSVQDVALVPVHSESPAAHAGQTVTV